MVQGLRLHLRVKMGKHYVKFIQTKQIIHVLHSYQPNSIFFQIDGDDFCQKRNREKQNRE